MPRKPPSQKPSPSRRSRSDTSVEPASRSINTELAVALGHFWRNEPRLRPGKMFGLPAFYLGRRLVACIYGEALVLRLPEPMVAALIAAGRGYVFRPMPKITMRSWLLVPSGPGEVADQADLLAASLDYVATLREPPASTRRARGAPPGAKGRKPGPRPKRPTQP